MAGDRQLNYRAVPLPDRPEFAPERARDFLGQMRKRHTIREFSGSAVGREVIEACIAAAGTAPSGANRQPWHFVAIAAPDMKAKIRAAAEAEEREFYAGSAGEEWLAALAPIGTGPEKPHLTTAPWLLVVFAQRYGEDAKGAKVKNYYVPESVGIAAGFLIAALHLAGLAVLTHTPAPMKFLTEICGRPASEKPLMILAVGHAAAGATVPAAALVKKPLSAIMSAFA